MLQECCEILGCIPFFMEKMRRLCLEVGGTVCSGETLSCMYDFCHPLVDGSFFGSGILGFVTVYLCLVGGNEHPELFALQDPIISYEIIIVSMDYILFPPTNIEAVQMSITNSVHWGLLQCMGLTTALTDLL